MAKLRLYLRLLRLLAVIALGTLLAGLVSLLERLLRHDLMGLRQRMSRWFFARMSNALPFVIALAEKGTRRALEEDPHLCNGLNVAKGMITCASVAEAHGLPYQSASSVLEHL